MPIVSKAKVFYKHVGAVLDRAYLDISDNLNLIRGEIAESCRAVGRTVGDVDLMLVTKTVSVERIAEALRLGCVLFGENKVQEVEQKWGAPELNRLKPDFIGHLQTNKVKVCLDVCGRIHSVDRMSLVETLDRELQKRGESRDVFLQVNTSQEQSKYGVSAERALEFARQVAAYPTLRVTGLMTLAMFSQDVEEVRRCFRNLKSLHSEIDEAGVFGSSFQHLSMGMTSDYKIAIEEGSTIVRLGQAIFGDRGTPDSYYWPST